MVLLQSNQTIGATNESIIITQDKIGNQLMYEPMVHQINDSSFID